MKKIVSKIFVMVALLSSSLYSFCYADEIDPLYPRNPIPRMPEPETNDLEKPVTIIAIGLIVIVISAIAILVLKKSGKKEKSN